VSGNPGGRAKGSGWTMETRQRLRTESAIHILGAMHRLALAGDTKAA